MNKNQDNQREAILLSYLAGIIDGEGCIRLQTIKNNPRWNTQYHAAISIGMTDKKVIQMFADRYGSKIGVECVPNRKAVYRWKKAGNKIVPPILTELLPYLIVKKPQAELVLKYYNERKKCGGITIRICRKCGIKKRIQGYGLCSACYQKERRVKNLDKYKKGYTNTKWLSKKELLWRKEIYRQMKELNAIGAPAETKQEDTREGEVIVPSHKQL